MSSKADFFIFSASVTVDSIETVFKKSRKRSAVTTWMHARTPQNQELEYKGKNRIFYCKYCLDKLYSTPVSTSFRYHLKSKHNISIEITHGPIQTATQNQLQQLYSRAVSSGKTEEINTQVLQRILDQNLINKVLILLITVRNLFFRLVK